jgi:hypothetical protein
MTKPTQDDLETAVMVVDQYVQYLETHEPYATMSIREAQNVRRALEGEVNEVFSRG